MTVDCSRATLCTCLKSATVLFTVELLHTRAGTLLAMLQVGLDSQYLITHQVLGYIRCSDALLHTNQETLPLCLLHSRRLGRAHLAKDVSISITNSLDFHKPSKDREPMLSGMASTPTVPRPQAP